MFWELLAVIFAGLAGAGVMLLLTRFLPLPKWLVPVGAGAAMLAATVSSEYGWYPRTVAALPDTVEVADTVTETQLWRPWTYLAPLTTRFIAVDTGRLQANHETPQVYLTEVYFFARWQPTTGVQMMVDCGGLRISTPRGGDGGTPAWQDAQADHPVLRTVCEAAS